MAGWYEKVDSFLGGILPGGVGLGTPFGSSAAEAATPGGVSGYAPAPARPAGAMQMPSLGGVPMDQRAARNGAPKGRLLTCIARQYPDGTLVPIRVTPGGVALYSRDLAAARRAKRVQKVVNRLFPRRMARKKTTRVVYRSGGKRK